jgi:hypothetical protein
METKYIISLREEINTGKGVTRRLDVVSFNSDAALSSFLDLTLLDGRRMWVNKNNVKSIVPENKTTGNENY